MNEEFTDYKQRVFCEDCRWFAYRVLERNQKHTKRLPVCKHPTNFIFIDTWCQRRKLYQIHPRDKNKNGYCLHFKKSILKEIKE